MASHNGGLRSQSSFPQQQQQQQQLRNNPHHYHLLQENNEIYAVSPHIAPTTSSIVVAHNIFQHQHHRRQCSASSTCTTFTVATSDSNYNEDGDNLSLPSTSSCHHSDNNRKILHEVDFSSPTSWEFRDNCSHRRLSSHQNHYSLHRQFSSIQMPATAASASSPMVLPLSLPPQASSSSGGSSLSTTPSPLEEHGPGSSSSYYPFPMQLSLLRNNNGSSSPGTQGVLSVRSVSNSGNCSCVALTNSNHSATVINEGGGCAGEELILSSHDLTNGNGSDGSRNSTGSHRSQDSGFSDSGETRRRKSSSNGEGIIINSPVAADMSFQGNHTGSMSGTRVLNGSMNHSHYLPAQQNSMNGHYQQQHQQQVLYNGNGAEDYETLNGPNSNCCGTRNRPVSPNIQNLYGRCTPVLHHHHHPQLQSNPRSSNHIYDCIPPHTMPSPIPSASFSCGRFMASPSPHDMQPMISDNAVMHGRVLSKRPTPPKRPASVDISTLDSHGNSCNSHNGIISRRRSPSPSSPAATTTCANCLSSSINFHNHHHHHHQQQQRRSFSPSRTHDISALASSSTATAMAALQVPLSSSTPNRAPSSSRLLGNGSANMVKIDNFESLNKNVNKDNNNNSSANGSASNTPGKKSSKTFTIQSEHNKDSTTSSPSVSHHSSNLKQNGTVLAEGESQLRSRSNDSSNQREVANQQSKQCTSTSKGRTAAESIYDKICSRLSSFSSSTSSSTAASPSATNCENQTVALLQKTSNSNINCSNSSSKPAFSLSSSSSQNFEVPQANYKSVSDPLHCDASSQSISTVPDNARSIHASAEHHEHSERKSLSSSSSSSSSSSKFKLFHRTSSQKSLSLPRGLSSKRLSIFEEVGIDADSKPELEPVSAPSPKSVTTTTSTQTSPSAAWKTIEQQADSQVVRLWLQDLRTQTEPECLHSLQTKWIVPADYSHGEEEDEDEAELESEDVPRSSIDSRSISPATSSTITTGTLASTTTGGHGIISSSSSSLTSTRRANDTKTFCSKPSPTSTGDYVIGPMVSSSVRYISSNSNHIKPSSSTSYIAKHRQRRSQQKFLSSMTAAIHAVSTPLMSIRNVEMTANIISGEFSKICKHLEFGIFTQVPTLVLSLVGHIEDFLRGFRSHVRITGSGGFSNLKKLESRLENACVALDMAAKSMNETALMMSSSTESGRAGSTSNPPPPPLPPRLSSSSSSSSTPISSPDCPPGGHSNRSSGDSNNDCIGGVNDPYVVLSSPSPFSSDHEPESLDRQQYHVVIGEVVEGIVTVGNLFSQVVDLRLTRDLASILDTIEGGGIPGRIALKSLATVLADGGNHICRLAADIRTVRGLLGVLLDTREDQDKILALRCLATVLCVGEAVKDFDKAGGFEIIADLLYDAAYSMWMKIEAVAVLTQATDPWIDLESTLMTLGVHLEKFIVSLTKLTREFKTEEEPFLLIVAAISNLTFLEVASTEYLKKCRTVSFLIDAVQGGNSNFSVFVLDHIATILANMAGVESCRQEIIQCGGIDALLQFLQLRPSIPGKTDSVSAITACERLQQKSTIALSRLANEDGVARYVFDMGGVHRLVTLCRKEKERNYSDGVLIAALATLRKLVSICGEDAVKGLGGAEDLIEPRLLDSFLLYSSRQESYV